MKTASSFLKRNWVFTTFAFWRLVIFLPLIAALYFIPYKIPEQITYTYSQSNSEILNVLFSSSANFDGIHYLNIARYGYTNQARFFPLFPLTLNLVSANIFITVLLVSAIFFTALFFLNKLIQLDFSKKISRKSILYVLIFPTSFFFVCIYSESLFLLFTLLAFYFARQKKWYLACFFGMLLTATRFVGIAILPALLYEFLISNRYSLNNKNLLGLINKFLPFLIIPLGLVSYSFFNYYKWHNFFYFIYAQGELGNNRSVNSVILFPQTVFRYIKILTTVAADPTVCGIALLELMTFVFVSFLIYKAWKNKIRTSYLIYVLINFGIAVSTGTFSGLPRYVIVLFPIFIVLALVKSKLWNLLYIIISPILLFVLLMLFSRGYFIA